MTRAFVVFILTIVFVSCDNSLESVRTKFGIDQNVNRAVLNLVAVDPDMEIKEDITLEARRFIFVNKKELSISSPAYLRKIIVLDSVRNSISIEDDFYKNPNENKEMIVSHKYYSGQTTIVLQAGKGSMEIDTKQADSVLRAWRIKQNPFSHLQ